MQAAELDSKFVRGFTRAAKAHLCMGQYAVAERLYRQALAVDSSNREAAAELKVLRSPICPKVCIGCVLCAIVFQEINHGTLSINDASMASC